MGPQEDTSATEELATRHDDPRGRQPRFAPAAERLGARRRRARHHALARGDSRMTARRLDVSGRASRADRALSGRSRPSSWPRRWSSGSRWSAVTCCASRCPGPRRSPGCCSVWLMCVGGIAALRHGQHPRVTALLRLLRVPRRAGRGPWTAARAARIFPLPDRAGVGVTWRAPASACPPAASLAPAISAVLPVALLLMSAVSLQQIRADGLAVWRDVFARAGRSAPPAW